MKWLSYCGSLFFLFLIVGECYNVFFIHEKGLVVNRLFSFFINFLFSCYFYKRSRLLKRIAILTAFLGIINIYYFGSFQNEVPKFEFTYPITDILFSGLRLKHPFKVIPCLFYPSFLIYHLFLLIEILERKNRQKGIS